MATQKKGSVTATCRAAAWLLPFLLCSCFTLALWGFEPSDERDPFTGERDSDWEYRDETEWSWPLFGVRVLATPLTLLLDCATLGVQVWLWGEDGDEQNAPGSRQRRGC
jgi:hypothetical protein